MILFGSGTLIAKPVSGNLAANPTPMAVGILQDCQVEISREIKELYGQDQMPVAIAPAKHKMTAKAKFAQIFGKQWTDLVFGQSTATAYNAFSVSPSTAIPTTPFQITPSIPGGGTFVEDLGVVNAATGLPFTRVASGPVAGQYSVNEGTGVYTFASADQVSGISVVISFIYTVSTGGVKMTFANQLMGYGPIFEANLVVAYNNQAALLRIFNCVCSKISLPTKNDDFVIPDFEFSAFANAAGNVFEIDTTQ
ncbi:MAG TPA: hypothetical protein VKY31_01465 [Terriglobia bacterium]|nr:hypothetical protein [Terriglobia bacterium]HZP34180.1 hypothetical protein [Candidatus Acidoferrales bacterium]